MQRNDFHCKQATSMILFMDVKALDAKDHFKKSDLFVCDKQIKQAFCIILSCFLLLTSYMIGWCKLQPTYKYRYFPQRCKKIFLIQTL